MSHPDPTKEYCECEERHDPGCPQLAREEREMRAAWGAAKARPKCDDCGDPLGDSSGDYCQDCCEHGDTDCGHCLDCGKDCTEDMMAAAYDRAKDAKYGD